MTDARLRGFERAAATGSTEDEVAYLLERVRVGDLVTDRLELAAYCGHEAARAALDKTLWELARHWPLEVFLTGDRWVCSGSMGSISSDDVPDDDGWCITPNHEGREKLPGLHRWPGAPVRAAVAAGGAVLPVWEEDPRNWRGGEYYTHVDLRPRLALEAAEAWIACPCEKHWKAWEEAWLATGPPELASFVPVPPGILNETVRPTTIQVAVRLTDEPTIRTAICRALVPWALGEEA